MIKGLEHLSYELSWFQLRQSLGLFSVEKKRLGGDLINECKYPKAGFTEDRARPLSMVPSDRTRGNGYTLKHRRSRLNISKHFFTQSKVKQEKKRKEKKRNKKGREEKRREEKRREEKRREEKRREEKRREEKRGEEKRKGKRKRKEKEIREFTIIPKL
ncbi:hypothetical protein QYF61_018503 [Mycteria americana]|uniref:Uncharacterized protein n=1 Tax=Mycteria americana TaxID=33587 RepID=A0AAN7NHS6_MYCAM|nr:hypothetical protein QYF61_018503 [Mycteria americana]